jgi:hypothetical protein
VSRYRPLNEIVKSHVWTHGKPWAGLVEIDEPSYISDSVRSPTFNAVLTASPRLVAFSFRKML